LTRMHNIAVSIPQKLLVGDICAESVVARRFLPRKRANAGFQIRGLPVLCIAPAVGFVASDRTKFPACQRDKRKSNSLIRWASGFRFDETMMRLMAWQARAPDGAF